MQPALNVNNRAKYHSNQRKVSQFIAENVTPKRPQDEADTKILATNL